MTSTFSDDTVRVIGEIENERHRQIDVEGWSPSHDDTHVEGELAQAAACYAHPRPRAYPDPRITDPLDWPSSWGGGFKPKAYPSMRERLPISWPGRRRDLIRAAALIVAEIERIDRAIAANRLSGAEPFRSPGPAPQPYVRRTPVVRMTRPPVKP